MCYHGAREDEISSSLFCGQSVTKMRGVGAVTKRWQEMVEHKYPGEMEIYPLADVHYGSIECNEKAWEAVIKEILEKPNRFCVLNGDLVDNGVKSSVTNCYEATCPPSAQKKYMVDALRPLAEAGRIILATSGNHEYRTKRESDQDITHDILTKLDCEDVFRPDVAFLVCRVGDRGIGNNHQPNISYNIVMVHGTGGGYLPGSTLNRNERFATQYIDGVDIAIVSHSHRGMVSRPSKLVINSQAMNVTQRDILVVSSVAWMDYGGYAMRKMLPPQTSCNPQKIILGDNTYRERDIRVVW